MRMNYETPELQMDLVNRFIEICKWLEYGHPISEVLQRLIKFDVDQLELLCKNARIGERKAQFGILSMQSLVVIEEYCSLVRVQDRVCAAVRSA